MSNAVHYEQIPPPTDADFYKDCLYYKEGVHGFIFYWNAELGWLKSTMQNNDFSTFNRIENIKKFK